MTIKADRYIIRWRIGRSVDATVRWFSIPTADPNAVSRLLDASRGATSGELLVSRDHGPTRRTSVMTNRRLLRKWSPAAGDLPEPYEGAWSRELALGDRRLIFIRNVRTMMRQGADAGVLDLVQAASIAHAVILALDGAGPFAAFRARR